MNPSETWWGVLLGGVIGSVIGGAITFAALWLTVRHERRLRDENLLIESAARAYGTAHEYLLAVTLRKRDGAVEDRQVSEAFIGFTRDAMALTALAGRRSPALATSLDNVLSDLLGGRAEGTMDTLPVRAFMSRLSAWLSDPGTYEEVGGRALRRRGAQQR